MNNETYELKAGRDEQVEQGLEVAYLLPEESPIRLKLLESLAMKCIYGSQKIGFFTQDVSETEGK